MRLKNSLCRRKHSSTSESTFAISSLLTPPGCGPSPSNWPGCRLPRTSFLFVISLGDYAPCAEFPPTSYGIIGLLRAMQNRGRPGFDAGAEAAQGMPRTSDLVNPSGNTLNANDERFALAA